MNPWKPHEIAELTPLLLLCIASEKTPDKIASDQRNQRNQMGLLYRDGIGPG
jgi:hypothetical protein